MYITSPKAAELRNFKEEYIKVGLKQHIFLLCRTLTFLEKKNMM